MQPIVSFYDLAERCLLEPSIESKLAVTDEAAVLMTAGQLDFTTLARPPLPTSAVRFPDQPRQVPPRDLPRRRLNSREGRVAFLHAVAHIEFTAILLAWDMAYRFRDMPEDFQRDWLGVAVEEARHFRALSRRLAAWGACYGDLPAHGGLWSVAETTAGDVLHRLAVVPRFMEARGLDVTPAMIEKLAGLGDDESIAVLELILREEIGHVALGSRWFFRVCDERDLDAETEYFALITQYVAGEARGPFNRQARLQAGFSERELKRLNDSLVSGRA